MANADPQAEALAIKRKDLFQKHEVVVTIVLATFLQFTAIAKLIPEAITDSSYGYRIAGVSLVALLLITEIWMMRRIGIWLLTARSMRGPGELKASLRVFVSLWLAFLALDVFAYLHLKVASMPFSALLAVWMFTYFVSGRYCRRVML